MAFFPYEDIVNLPRPVSKKYVPASVSDRAARFSPFAAITGYEEMVLEAARVTEEKIILAEDEMALINEKLRMISACISEKPKAAVTYFVADEKKSGGAYVSLKGNVVNVDINVGCLVFSDGERVPFEDILEFEFL